MTKEEILKKLNSDLELHGRNEETIKEHMSKARKGKGMLRYTGHSFILRHYK